MLPHSVRHTCLNDVEELSPLYCLLPSLYIAQFESYNPMRLISPLFVHFHVLLS